MMEYACRRYAKMGYAAATMNYSFINSEDEYGSLPTMDKEVWSCVKHIKSALRQRGITVSNLAVGGHSAGGQIAATFALKHAEDSPVPVRFVIVESAPVDLVKAFPVDESKLAKVREGLRTGKTDIPEKRDIDNLVRNASNVTMRNDMYEKSKVEELIKVSSPVALVGDKSVPLILAYGAKDFLAQPAQYEALESAYKRFNRPFTLIVYPNSGHNLDGDADKTLQLQNTVKEHLEKDFVK